jgi:hypothetical protein
MSRRSDRFKKILPTDVPRRGLNVGVNTQGTKTVRIDVTKPNLSNRPRVPNFEGGAVQGDSPGTLRPKAKPRIIHTEFRIKLDFTVRVDGDQVMPDAFGPRYMEFIAAGLKATMLKEAEYEKGELAVDVLPGSTLGMSVKRIKEKA